MTIREITGYIANALLAGYWLVLLSSTAPQLRKGRRDRSRTVRIALVRTAAVLLTASVVWVIHFSATEWWHVVLALVLAAALGVPLRRAYRSLVAAPKHRLTLRQRARTFDRRPRVGR